MPFIDLDNNASSTQAISKEVNTTLPPLGNMTNAGTSSSATTPTEPQTETKPNTDNLPAIETLPDPAKLEIKEQAEVENTLSPIREVAGPSFPADAPKPLAQDADKPDLDAKLTALADLAAEPVPNLVNSSTPSESLPADLSAQPEGETGFKTLDIPASTSTAEVPEPEPESSPEEVENSIQIGNDQSETQAEVAISEPLPEAKPELETPEVNQINLDSESLTPAVPDTTEQVLDLSLEKPEPLPPVPAASTPELRPANLPIENDSAPALQSKVYSLEDLLSQAIEAKASDLHLSAGYRATVRVDGKLRELRSNVLNGDEIKEMLQGVVASKEGLTLDAANDIDMAYQVGNSRFRVNIFRQQKTFAAVFRLIPSEIRSLADLKLPAKVGELTNLAQGLVLVTGPTGSGKSTTIAALLNEINQREPKHITTIEDPIEYVYPKARAIVDQRGIGEDTESWSEALRSVLRQDPDVVLIGEMRDYETVSSAVRVAETGHLVFASLHTNNAAQSIDRIIDFFPDEQQSQIRSQLAAVLMAVVSQRLVPLTTGGQRVAVELLLATSAVRNSIRSNKVYQIDNIIQTGAELGMMTMEKSLVDLVREGVISVEQAQYYSNHPDDIISLLSQN